MNLWLCAHFSFIIFFINLCSTTVKCFSSAESQEVLYSIRVAGTCLSSAHRQDGNLISSETLEQAS
jgi:hypothetical protein